MTSTYMVVLMLLCFLKTSECFSVTSCRSVSSSLGVELRCAPRMNTFLAANLQGLGGASNDQYRITNISEGNKDDITGRTSFFNRREMMSSLAFHSAVAVALTATSSSAVYAADSASSSTAPANPFLRYRQIPTFCIVNGAGVPYMIFNRATASATGYFFMSYQVAVSVLDDARRKEGAQELWSDARIVTIPLDIALKLALAKLPRKAINNNDQVTDTFNDIVPAEEGVDDAKSIDNKNGQNANRWLQKGRTPLFYVKDKGQSTVRYYFTRKDLIAEWTNSESPPNIQVLEMADLFRKTGIDKIQNIEIVPSPATKKAADELMQKQQQQGTSPYSFKEVIVVSSA